MNVFSGGIVEGSAIQLDPSVGLEAIGFFASAEAKFSSNSMPPQDPPERQ